jgi:hypothetical protein
MDYMTATRISASIHYKLSVNAHPFVFCPWIRDNIQDQRKSGAGKQAKNGYGDCIGKLTIDVPN